MRFIDNAWWTDGDRRKEVGGCTIRTTGHRIPQKIKTPTNIIRPKLRKFVELGLDLFPGPMKGMGFDGFRRD